MSRAGRPGLEPGGPVLETGRLPINGSPLFMLVAGVGFEPTAVAL